MKCDIFAAQAVQTDAKKDTDTGRRYRNIIANSGLEMESGEVRDLDALYVMSRKGELVLIKDLHTDPDKQSEKYQVAFATNHGHNDEVTGERTVEVEDIIGDAKVWLEEDGLHARVYFANDDPKADHAYAVSDNASYSIGTEWYEDGYIGAGERVDGLVGILREISMVDVGNDPRACTIDHKPVLAQAQGGASAGDGEQNNDKKGSFMKTKLDKLTPEEATGLLEGIVDTIDKYVEADGTEDKKDEEEVKTDSEETTTEAPAEETPAEKTDKKAKKDVLRSPVVVIRDRAVKQSMPVNTAAKNYLKTDRAVAAWGKALMASNGDAKAWRDNFRAIAKKDGVDFGSDATIAPEAVINAVAVQMEDEDTIFAHVNKTGLAFEIVAIPTSEPGGVGHVRGKRKTEENIQGDKRVLTPADLYKLMKLDHSMVKLNGGVGSSAIVKYVLSELPRKLLETINKGILVGGIATDSQEEGETVFTALNPILSDISGSTIYATEYEAVAGDNLRQTVSKAANKVLSSSDRSLICPPDYLTNLENATTSGGQLLFPNGIAKNDPRINGIRRIIAPLWLTANMLGDYEAIVADLSNYHVVGDSTPESFADYDIDVNKYVWEAVACIGGGLANKNAAVGIKKSSTTGS